ncbi:hypothetical protein HMPREF1624_01650 [Sporothrix schenckii ATCC 58251]|uniref:Alpha/beta hydrolase fold-3 domain-containing protein n=1 Tax=Sporothrix schenckii (strain ATCC 58251 / de Perez 2211183) TaxID=1391915 RepID=U7Q676_SPOS1|nr:hypothetical protein HMPREF1624_01650 [Sporothrix schenckii ATCC 58251]
MADCTCQTSSAKCARHDAPPTLPLSQKLSFLGYVFFLVFRRGLPLRKYLTSAFLGASLLHLKPGHIQYASPTSRQVYRAFMTSMLSKAQRRGQTDLVASLQTDTQPLPVGDASLLWMGSRKTARKFVLFFHGGGYVAPLMPGHVEWCWRVFVAPHIGTPNEVAVAMLDYTLCPAAQYPTVLKQAVAALESLLASGVRPDQIVVGGDSAGGNLTAHLLRHLLRPEPHAPPVHLAQPLLGAFLVSPWLTSDIAQVAMVENNGVDMICPRHIGLTTYHFYGAQPLPKDEDLVHGTESAYDNLASVVGDVYVTAGQQEVLRDQAVMWVDKVRRRNAGLKIELAVARDEGHDFILLEGDQQQTGPAMERMKAWSLDLIQGEGQKGKP